MENFDRKKHWEKIYNKTELKNVSWYQPTPETSLGFIKDFEIHKDAKIIDIGGGDSFFTDFLLEKGYKDITVLDISESAIERAKQRLGDKAHKVKWIIADATEFKPDEKYDFWHDRAAFHFLSDKHEIDNYIKTASKNINKEGIMVIGTFSENGPEKCSGITIKKYSENEMTELTKGAFRKVKCFTIDHKTPSGSLQNFIFCSFKKT